MGSQLGSGKGSKQCIKGTKSTEGCIERGPFSIDHDQKGKESLSEPLGIEGETAPQGTQNTFLAGEYDKLKG